MAQGIANKGSHDGAGGAVLDGCVWHMILLSGLRLHLLILKFHLGIEVRITNYKLRKKRQPSVL
jgi:hypothetical protein